MLAIDQLNHAIAAHGSWRVLLKKAIDAGHSDLQVATVARDDRCDFGRWFHALPAAERDSERGRTIRDLHARFHKEAAHVIELAHTGRQPEARAALDANSPFGRVSDDLILALTAWKRSLQP